MTAKKHAEWSRRDALKGAGAAAFVVACDRDGEPRLEPLEDFELLREHIDTVVVLMMENRSFDHYFGALTLEEGRADVEGLTPDISNPHPDGHAVTPELSQVNCLHDPPHSWASCHAQFNDGANDGFVTEFYLRAPEVAHEAMAYLNRDKLPAFYSLADAYTICDQWFSSLMTSTQPNRFYFHCGQNQGVTNNDIPVGQDYPSIYTRVADAGLEWATYYANVPGVILVPDRFIGDHQIQFIDAFFEDAAAGTLPNLVFIEPAYGRNDDHPPAHPTAGQVFCAQIYDALAASPQWDRIAFFITYDEHGGFHDHVPPPKAPDAFAKEGFDQLGFRVPSLVIGPWAKPGHVSHTVYDHTSMLAFIEHLFELEPLSERDAAADPMRDCFDWQALETNTPHPPVILKPIVADEEELYSEACVTDGSDLRRSRTHQDELEAYVKAHHAGSRIDRIDDTDETYAWLLALAEERGILVRRSR
jgi:phospholipase C